jgi:hypothetical protein
MEGEELTYKAARRGEMAERSGRGKGVKSECEGRKIGSNKRQYRGKSGISALASSDASRSTLLDVGVGPRRERSRKYI